MFHDDVEEEEGELTVYAETLCDDELRNVVDEGDWHAASLWKRHESSSQES